MTEKIWLVKHKPSLEQVLAMVRGRHEPDAYNIKDYWFDNLTEAQEFQFTESLRTGNTFSLQHRDDISSSTKKHINKLLEKSNG